VPPVHGSSSRASDASPNSSDGRPLLNRWNWKRVAENTACRASMQDQMMLLRPIICAAMPAKSGLARSSGWLPIVCVIPTPASDPNDEATSWM